MPALRVKICGVTLPEDAEHAANAGAHAIGMVLHAPGPRRIRARQAAEICSALPPFITRVGLCQDADPDEIKRTLDEVPLDLLQFHGSETPDYCRQFGIPYIKAVAMGNDSTNLVQINAEYAEARALLMDSHRTGESGGSGKTLDWNAVGKMLGGFPRERLILAGGLNPANVATAAKQTGIRAVDLSSGVESEPGITDHQLISAFINAAQQFKPPTP